MPDGGGASAVNVVGRADTVLCPSATRLTFVPAGRFVTSISPGVATSETSGTPASLPPLLPQVQTWPVKSTAAAVIDPASIAPMTTGEPP